MTDRFSCLFSFADNYPDFEPHFDETGQITVPDYMYVYTLLIHFSCVQQNDPWFQQICLALNPKCQNTVADFFDCLCRHEKFDRNTIRQAISTSSPAVPRLSFQRLSTPVGTPVKGIQMQFPGTPIAHLLDAKNGEAKSLRAQLEAEKHERSYLEVQVQKLEERLNKYSEFSRATYKFHDLS